MRDESLYAELGCRIPRDPPTPTCGTCVHFQRRVVVEGFDAGSCSAPVPMSANQDSSALFSFDNARKCRCYVAIPLIASIGRNEPGAA